MGKSKPWGHIAESTEVVLQPPRLKDLKDSYLGRTVTLKGPFAGIEGTFRGSVFKIGSKFTYLTQGKRTIRVKTSAFAIMDAVGRITILKKGR